MIETITHLLLKSWSKPEGTIRGLLQSAVLQVRFLSEAHEGQKVKQAGITVNISADQCKYCVHSHFKSSHNY